MRRAARAAPCAGSPQRAQGACGHLHERVAQLPAERAALAQPHAALGQRAQRDAVRGLQVEANPPGRVRLRAAARPAANRAASEEERRVRAQAQLAKRAHAAQSARTAAKVRERCRGRRARALGEGADVGAVGQPQHLHLVNELVRARAQARDGLRVRRAAQGEWPQRARAARALDLARVRALEGGGAHVLAGRREAGREALADVVEHAVHARRAAVHQAALPILPQVVQDEGELLDRRGAVREHAVDPRGLLRRVRAQERLLKALLGERRRQPGLK